MVFVQGDDDCLFQKVARRGGTYDCGSNACECDVDLILDVLNNCLPCMCSVLSMEHAGWLRRCFQLVVRRMG